MCPHDNQVSLFPQKSEDLSGPPKGDYGNDEVGTSRPTEEPEDPRRMGDRNRRTTYQDVRSDTGSVPRRRWRGGSWAVYDEESRATHRLAGVTPPALFLDQVGTDSSSQPGG